jgi:hypothetical protein
MPKDNPAEAPLPVNIKRQSAISEKLASLSREVLGGTITDERGFPRKDYAFSCRTPSTLSRSTLGSWKNCLRISPAA